MRVSTLSRPKVSLQAKPLAKLPNTQNAESNAENLEIDRVENIRLFADDDWLPPSASQIPFLSDIDLTPFPAVNTPLSHTQLNARPSVMSDSLHVSRLQSRVPPPCRHSRVSLPCRCHSRSHLLLTPPSRGFLESIEYLSFSFASRASPEDRSSSRPDYEWCNRDEQLWWLSRREQ